MWLATLTTLLRRVKVLPRLPVFQELYILKNPLSSARYEPTDVVLKLACYPKTTETNHMSSMKIPQQPVLYSVTSYCKTYSYGVKVVGKQ